MCWAHESNPEELRDCLVADSRFLKRRLDELFSSLDVPLIEPQRFQLREKNPTETWDEHVSAISLELRVLCGEALDALEASVIESDELPEAWHREIRWWPGEPIRNPHELSAYIKRVVAKDGEPVFNRPRLESDEEALFLKLVANSSLAALTNWGYRCDGLDLEKLATTKRPIAILTKIAVSINQSDSSVVPGIVGVQKSVTAPLTKDEIRVISALASDPQRCWLQVELETESDISRRTIGPLLQSLKSYGLVHWPRGERKGVAITDLGLSHASRIASIHD